MEGGALGPPPGWDAPREPPAPALNEPEERGEAAQAQAVG